MAFGRFYQQHRRTILASWAVICLALAAVYLIIRPEVAGEGVVAAIILKYFHSLTWLLLAGAAVSALVRRGSRITSWIAYAGLGCYLVFIVTYVL